MSRYSGVKVQSKVRKQKTICLFSIHLCFLPRLYVGQRPSGLVIICVSIGIDNSISVDPWSGVRICEIRSCRGEIRSVRLHTSRNFMD